MAGIINGLPWGACPQQGEKEQRGRELALRRCEKTQVRFRRDGAESIVEKLSRCRQCLHDEVESHTGRRFLVLGPWSCSRGLPHHALRRKAEAAHKLLEARVRP